MTRRANSVLPHGEGSDLDDDALDALLAETVRLYTQHGLIPWLQVSGAAWPPRLEERLTTEPAARRRGVATRAVLALGAWAEARGASRSLLAVQEWNVAARGQYGSLGFQEASSYAYARPGP